MRSGYTLIVLQPQAPIGTISRTENHTREYISDANKNAMLPNRFLSSINTFKEDNYRKWRENTKSEDIHLSCDVLFNKLSIERTEPRFAVDI